MHALEVEEKSRKYFPRPGDERHTDPGWAKMGGGNGTCERKEGVEGKKINEENTLSP